MNYPAWDLGVEHQSSVETVCAFDLQTISLAPLYKIDSKILSFLSMVLRDKPRVLCLPV